MAETEDPRQYTVTYHPGSPTNVIYAGQGRACPTCGGFYMCSDDYDAHRKRGRCIPKEPMQSISSEEIERLNWRPFKNLERKDKWVFRETAPGLTRLLQQKGATKIGRSTYRLSGDRFIVRTETFT